MPKDSRVCEYCGASYSKKEHYERHIRTHTRERPFSCNSSQCSSKFSRQDALLRHKRICHPSEGNTISEDQRDSITIEAGDVQPHSALPSPVQSANPDELFPNTGVNNDHPASNDAATIPMTDLGWQWDDTLNLDASFSIDDLYAFDPNTADLSTPWLPLLQYGELGTPPMPASSAFVDSVPPTRVTPQWFTHIITPRSHLGPSAGPSRCATPTAAAAEGEISRDALASSLVLRQPLPNTALPSAKFLNRCIHTFTTRLWPVIPVVHLPTFRPARTNPLLLLSICSLGALADGSEQALFHAERLFDGVQKAILVSFAPDRALDKQTLAALQAAVLGQTFALLSGKPEHLTIAQAFHSALFVAARKYHAFMIASRSRPEASPSTLGTKEWNEWVTAQTIIRLLNAVYVHNGEVAAITQQPAFLRTKPLSIPIAAHDSLFLAKTADEWAELQHALDAQPLPQQSVLSSCAILECFIGEIRHARCSSFHAMDDRHIDDYQTALHKWFMESADSFRIDRVQRITMLSLWHSWFLLLLCDINHVERVCGRDGTRNTDEDIKDLRSWARTAHAKNCIAHAVLLCRLMDDMRISDVPAAHQARSLWHAGLILAVSSSLAAKDAQSLGMDVPRSSIAEQHSPGIDALRQQGFLTDQDIDGLKDDTTPARCGTLASAASTTLRHLGPWPVAAYYASTLDQVLSLNEEL